MTTFKLNVQELKNRILNGGRITKREFDRLMVRGWKEKKKAYGRYEWRSVDGKMCAMGVVADELGLSGLYDGRKVAEALHNDALWSKIATASNEASSKSDAIKSVKAIQW